MNIPGRETANKEDIGGLKLRNQLEQKKDELVILAEGLWDETWGHGKSEMKNAQYRNLLNAALSTQSIEEVVNFIKYQIGRHNREWGKFGPLLITRIQDQIQTKVKGNNEFKMASLRLLLGYLIRYNEFKSQGMQ